jgi:hypothetical protein
MRDSQLARGDICGDPTGLLVRVEDVDVYDYVHFSVIESSDAEDGEDGRDEVESGQMSEVAFVHRFTKVGNLFSRGGAA